MYINKKSIYIIYLTFFLLFTAFVGSVIFLVKPIKEEQVKIKNQSIKVEINNENALINKQLKELRDKIVLIIDIQNHSQSDVNFYHENAIIGLNEHNITEDLLKSQDHQYLMQIFFTNNEEQSNFINYLSENSLPEQNVLKLLKTFGKNDTIKGISFHFTKTEKQKNKELAKIFTAINKNKNIFLINLNPDFRSQLFNNNLFFNVDHVIEINDNISDKIDNILHDVQEKLTFVHFKSYTTNQLQKFYKEINEVEIDIYSLQDLKDYIMNK